MSDSSKAGSDWSDEELDLAVADYFAMLEHELAGRAYVKAQHNRELDAQIGRGRGSIEFKHANISAVLAELGVPILRGYLPRYNFQQAIFPALDRYLSSRQEVFDLRPAQSLGVAEAVGIFEEPAPTPELGPRPSRPEGLERLVRKFDPGTRDFRNRALGKAGEAAVVDHERRKLSGAGREDLASKVRWVADVDGDGAGYDILSFAPDGAERLLEVKTTRGGRTTPFFLSRNEEALSNERPEAFRIIRLYEFGPSPRLFKIKPPLTQSLVLETETWRAGFG